MKGLKTQSGFPDSFLGIGASSFSIGMNGEESIWLPGSHERISFRGKVPDGGLVLWFGIRNV